MQADESYHLNEFESPITFIGLLASLMLPCNSVRVHLDCLPFGLNVCSPSCNLTSILKSPSLLYCLQLAGGSSVVLWRGCIMISSEEVTMYIILPFPLSPPPQNKFINPNFLKPNYRKAQGQKRPTFWTNDWGASPEGQEERLLQCHLVICSLSWGYEEPGG